MGIGPSDYLHPLIRTGYEEQATVLFASILADQSQEKLVDVHQCRENNPLAKSIIEKSLAETGPAVTILEQAKCLILDLPSTFDGYLAMLGKSLRYDVKKLEKSWFQSGLASIETANVESIDVAMTIFFDQHRRRWHGKGLPGAFLGRGVAFQREWTHLAALNGWMQLSTLRLDGQPIGSIYAMVLGQRSFYYQAGFDPEHKAISPGTLLVAHTIRRSIEEGKTEFDFMRGCEAYKLRWKPQRALSNLRIVLEDGEKGRLKSKWTMTGHRIEQRVRARLEGQGLRKS